MSRVIKWTLSKVEPADIWNHATKSAYSRVIDFMDGKIKPYKYNLGYSLGIKDPSHPVVGYLISNKIGTMDGWNELKVPFHQLIQNHESLPLESISIAIKEAKDVLKAYGNIDWPKNV